MIAEFPLSLYFDEPPADLRTLNLSRGEDDFRTVSIGGGLVIKRFSNTFSTPDRVRGWLRLMEEYRDLGIYCPRAVPNRLGELIHQDTADGRVYLTYAEEYAAYETAEHIGKEHWTDDRGRVQYMPDVLRSLGRVAAEELKILDWPTAYCLLEPFCSPDTTDEQTECAEGFVSTVAELCPRLLDRARGLLDLYYECQEGLRQVYAGLPTSCFQGDLNDSNILLDKQNRFVGLIDFNLCGREPILNYAVREALWGISDSRLKDRAYLYDQELDDLRMRLFLENIGYVQEHYRFTDREREVFPVLFRYLNSFWWFHLEELKRCKDDDEKIEAILDWLERQMTRDDVRL